MLALPAAGQALQSNDSRIAAGARPGGHRDGLSWAGYSASSTGSSPR